jgi:hypothetical protein
LKLQTKFIFMLDVEDNTNRRKKRGSH